jgi:hypothetical protein
MRKISLSAAVLAATISLGSVASMVAPAMADGLTSTRNIITVLGVGAAVGVTNYNHKKRIKNNEQNEQQRRQSEYRDWYYNKYGYYPSQQRVDDWYYRHYGVNPSK